MTRATGFRGLGTAAAWMAAAVGVALTAGPVRGGGLLHSPKELGVLRRTPQPAGVLNPDACFGYFPTHWTPWHVACPGYGAVPGVAPTMATLPPTLPTLPAVPTPDKPTTPPTGVP